MFVVFVGNGRFNTLHENKNKQMKKYNVYGVEMTSFQEMVFCKYLVNQGIAMNTKTKHERYLITENWIQTHFPLNQQ